MICAVSLDAEPDDQQDEIGELRQRPQEFDERAEERLDPAVVSHGQAEQRADDRAGDEAGQHALEAQPGMLPNAAAPVAVLERSTRPVPEQRRAGQEKLVDEPALGEQDPQQEPERRGSGE